MLCLEAAESARGRCGGNGLQEIYAAGGDVRRLCDFFGIRIDAAMRYTLVLTQVDPRGDSAQ